MTNAFSSQTYTFAYLARQTGGANGRFFVGNGNKLYGFHGGWKNIFHLEGWVADPRGNSDGSPAKLSNSKWDIVIIRRTPDGKSTINVNGLTYIKNKYGGQNFDNL